MKMTSASYEIANRTLKLSRTETGVQVEVLTLGAVSYRQHFYGKDIAEDVHHQTVWQFAKTIYGISPRNPSFPNCSNSEVGDLTTAIENLA